MQNRYVGDVGDFGKYGLLRALCQSQDGHPPLKLGVIWYLVPDESHNNDGKHISYLQPTPTNLERFRACDPELYDALQRIVSAGTRSVAEIERSGILGPHTTSYNRSLTYGGLRTRGEKLAFRQQWMAEALEAVKESNVIFIDPDNGLECSIQKQHRNAVKYTYYDEVDKLIQAGKSVLIYHHLSRQGKAETQIHNYLSEFPSHLGKKYSVLALRFHRGSARVFFLLAQNPHFHQIKAAIATMLDGKWKCHFSTGSNVSSTAS